MRGMPWTRDRPSSCARPGGADGHVHCWLLAALLFAPAGTLRYWQAGSLASSSSPALAARIGVYFLQARSGAGRAPHDRRPGGRDRSRRKRSSWSSLSIGFFSADARSRTRSPLALVRAFRHGWCSPARRASLASFVVFFVVMKQNSYAAATIRVEAGPAGRLHRALRRWCAIRCMPARCCWSVCMPLALGSYWTLLLLIAAISGAGLAAARRGALSQRAILPGYAEYCRRVRYRLIPGIW